MGQSILVPLLIHKISTISAQSVGYEPVAHLEFDWLGITINYSHGERYLGEFIRSAAILELLLGDMVA